MKKRMFSLALVAAMLLTLLPTWALAEGPPAAPLDLSDNPTDSGDLETDCYHWVQSTKTLTLDTFFLTLKTTEQNAYAISLPEGASIKVTGTSRIYLTGDGTSSNQTLTGIHAPGLVSFSGTRNLELYVDGHGTNLGINCSPSGGLNTTEFNGSNILYVGCSDSSESGAAKEQYGIYSAGGTVNIKKGTVKTNVSAATQVGVTVPVSYGIYAGTVHITGGTVSATSGQSSNGHSAGILATAGITFNLGLDSNSVTATADGFNGGSAIVCNAVNGITMTGMAAATGTDFGETAYLKSGKFYSNADGIGNPVTTVKITKTTPDKEAAKALAAALGNKTTCEGTVVTLQQATPRIPLTEGITVNGNVTIDLNGFEITTSDAPSFGNSTITVTGGTLTITDSSENKTGKIVGPKNTAADNGADTSPRTRAVSVASGATLTIHDGSFEGGAGDEASGVNVYGGGFAVYSEGTLEIYGGSFTGGKGSATNGGSGGTAVYAAAGSSLAFSSGTAVLTGGEGGRNNPAPAGGAGLATLVFAQPTAQVTIIGGKGGTSSASGAGGTGGPGVELGNTAMGGTLYSSAAITGGTGGNGSGTYANPYAKGGAGYMKAGATAQADSGLYGTLTSGQPGGWNGGNGGPGVNAPNVSSSLQNNGVITGGAGYGTQIKKIVSHVLTSITSPSDTVGPDKAILGFDYVTTLTAASGYVLPDTITVTVDGTALSAGTDYTYDKPTGKVTVKGDLLTATLTITAVGEIMVPKATLSGNLTLTAASTSKNLYLTLTTENIPPRTAFTIMGLPAGVTQSTPRITGDSIMVAIECDHVAWTAEAIPLSVKFEAVPTATIISNATLTLQKNNLYPNQVPNIGVVFGSSGSASFDLSSITYRDGVNPAERSYVLDALTDNNSIFSANPAISGTTLTYTPNPSANEGQMATQVITVKSRDYNDMTVTLTFVVADKTPITISGLSIASPAYTGNPHVGYTGTAVYSSATGDVTPAGTLEALYTGTANDNSSYNANIAPTKAGSYHVTVTLNDKNYSGKWEADFAINKAVATFVAPYVLSAYFGDTLQNVYLPTYYTWATPKTTSVGPVGNNTFYATYNPDTNNYHNSSSGSVTVKVDPKAVTVTAADATRDYGAENPIFDLSVADKNAGYTLEELGIALSTTATAASDAGTYSITGISTSANYAVTVTRGTLTVSQIALPVSPLAKTVRVGNSAIQTVNVAETVVGKAGTLLYTPGSVSGPNTGIILNPAVSTTGELSFTIKSDAAATNTATIPVTISGFTNYTDTTVDVTVTIAAKTPVEITIPNLSKTYDGEAVQAVPTAPNIPAEDLILTWQDSSGNGLSPNDPPKNAGSYRLKVDVGGASDADYEGTKTADFTITPKTVTVKADDKTITQNGNLPVFTVTYTGFLGADDAAKPLATFAVATSPTADASRTGTYPIVLSTQAVLSSAGANYTLGAQSGGSLTVNASGGGGSALPKPVEPKITTGDGFITVTIAAEVTTNGATATATGSQTRLNNALKAVPSTAKPGDTVTIEMTAQTPQNTQTVEVILPKAGLSALGNSQITAFTISSGVGNLTLSRAACAAIAGQAEGDTVRITVSKVNVETTLNARQKAAVGDAPVYDISIASGGKSISSFDVVSITVSLPYALKEGQKQAGVVMWYLNENGALEELPTVYDAKIKTVTFAPNHFSFYVIGYDAVAALPNPFSDVAESAYYRNAVLWAADKGVTTGTTATTFAPNVTCTRAQAVTFLWRAMGSPEPIATTNPFTDVNADTYYYKAVLWAAEKGITVGSSATTFSPDATVSRGQVATFLWRAAGKPGADKANSFTDVFADAYYFDAVIWAAEKGITGGTTSTTFSPTNPCSRGQITTFLYRYFGK